MPTQHVDYQSKSVINFFPVSCDIFLLINNKWGDNGVMRRMRTLRIKAIAVRVKIVLNFESVYRYK